MPQAAERDIRLLADGLSHIRDRWRTSLVLAGVLWVVAGLALVTLTASAAEALLFLSPGIRWVLLILAAGGTVAGGAWFVARPMIGRIPLERVARLLEVRRPQLGNTLIGGLQLTRAATPAPGLAAAAVHHAAVACARLEPDAVVDRAEVRRLARLCAVACALLVAGFAVSPTRMLGALKRVLLPGAFVPRVGSVRFDGGVLPGNSTILAGSDVTFQVNVLPSGGERHPAGRIFYRESGGAEFSRRLESPDGVRYLFTLRDVRRALRYRLEVGDSQTAYYDLTVVERPRVTGLDFEFRYPDFTARPPERFEDVTNREIRVPVGTEVLVTARANRPVEQAYLDFGDGTKQDLEISTRGLLGTFRVERSGSYAVVVQDRLGHRNLNPARYPIVALPDAPPTVRVTAPGRDLELPAGGELRVAVWATDDYGIGSLRLVFQRNRGGEPQELASWADPTDPRSVQRVHSWRLASRDFEPGDVVFYHAEASDRVQTGKSPTFRVKIVDPALARQEQLKDLADFIARLRKVLEQQLAARDLAGKLFRLPPPGAELLAGCRQLAALQREVRAETVAAAERAPLRDGLARRVRDAVLQLAGGEEEQAERLAAALAASEAGAADRGEQARLTGLQDAVIARLRELLQLLVKLQAEATEEDRQEGSDLPDDARRALEGLREKLGDFMDEQKKVLNAWNDLAKRPVEDLTEEEKKKLAALTATEDKWEKFLKEAHSDLSKLHKQDFTDPKLIKELIETYSEVEMAKDALTKAVKEIPVPLEQAGLESAESLTTHIEKWLPDTPDREQWSMEEPLTENQAPMAELPEQLEDLIGDLMEEQEDIFEEMEDTTSSWTDSLDKGAGWDTLDGPISNMSAQGVTGNRLPNSSEISGRSGEGRTGKAAGEFVEQTATGKGGRRTPTRLTPDQFLKGQIEDKSKDPAGGSTGGGKVGGSGGEGLEGPAPPDVEASAGRLAGKQAQILSRAERIRLELRLRNHPTADLDRVIRLMQGVESDMKDGRYRNIARQRDVVLEGLKTTRDFAAASSQVQREVTGALPKRLRDELFDAVDGGVPAGYEELVKRYYESIGSER